MRVFTIGVFDDLHHEHLSILTQAAVLGDLTVGIMTDQGVEDMRGVRPAHTLEERDAKIRSLPFVANVIHCTDVDHSAIYASVRPEIVVQGEDWLFSADHSAALKYLRENAIRLVLLPRTEAIPASEVHRRPVAVRRCDEHFLRERLRMVPIGKLKRYEAYDESKVGRLTTKIRNDRCFFNPICVVREMIVIDGANRFEALRRLGANVVPCMVYDYSEVDLLGNVQFIHNGVKTRLSEFAREQGERIEFAQRTPADIRMAAESGRLIPNGETFHRVPQSVIRLPIPLSALTSEEPFDLMAYVDRRIRDGQIRFYPSGVYVCDEWQESFRIQESHHGE